MASAFQPNAFQNNAFQSFSMRSYMFLEDHFLSGLYIPAGTIGTTNDIIPVNTITGASWIPTPNVDPLNSAAVGDFYAAGPRDQGLIRQQFQSIPVIKPVTYWVQVAPNTWKLTGLGSALAPVSAIVPHPIGNIPQ